VVASFSLNHSFVENFCERPLSSEKTLTKVIEEVFLLKTKTSNLAPMGVISFYGGVHHKRYNGQRVECLF
jgi:hypothetical protein